jgi:hypothetical protein
MQPEPINVSQNVSYQQSFPDTATTSQHGQRRSHDLHVSLQPHPGELRGEPGPQPRGFARDATRPETENAAGVVETNGLKGVASASPPPRDRITEYENALKTSPRKPADGPLFEIVKSNKKPNDKSSPIANLPNGAYKCLDHWHGFNT